MTNVFVCYRRKREQEMEQEMHRTARGGRPASGRRYAADGDYAGGSARRGTSAGSEYLRSRRDFLGYYKLLGITETGVCHICLHH